MGRVGVWLIAARPKTLAAAVVPVAVGTALAVRLDAWQALPAGLCLAFALLVQVGTNFANDYFDYVKGADTDERVGPTRVVAAGWVTVPAIRWAIVVAFALSFAVGLNLVFYGGWWLVVVGVASIACGLAYTAGPFPLAYHGLGDLFVFLFFGWVAVVFTLYVQSGIFAWEAFLAGAGVGALAVNILVVNNARDRETDARAGKRTLVVRFGPRFARIQYALSLAIAGTAPVVFWLVGFGAIVLLPLIAVALGGRLYVKLVKADSAASYGSILGGSGGTLMIYGALLTVGLLFS